MLHIGTFPFMYFVGKEIFAVFQYYMLSAKIFQQKNKITF